MQVNPLAAALPATPALAAAEQSLRVTAGDLTQIQTGVIVAATVLRAGSGEATLDVGGKPLTVRTGLALTPGDLLNVRVHAGANPTIDVVPPPRTTPTKLDTTPQPAAAPPEQADVVDVLTREPNGQYRVRIAGRETLATSEQPLTPGGRFVLRAETTATGTKLSPPLESPTLPATVATAVLRSTPVPQLGEAVRPLLNELQGVLTKNPAATPAVQPNPTTPAAPPDVQKAVGQVREVLESLLPQPGQPPTADTIRTVVQNGGQQFEAKLARVVEAADLPAQPPTAPANAKAVDTSRPAADAEATQDRPALGFTLQREAGSLTLKREPQPPAPSQNDTPVSPKAADRFTDLKGGLLNLLRAIPEAASAPVAVSVLDGIERQQAVNVLAQQNGGPLVFQIPFPDGRHWRTLNLGVEPDRSGPADADGRPTGYRVMMHVPLSELGETWIDAGADGSRLRAVLYVSDPAARERVRAELATLRPDVLAAGYSDVWLDVRPATALTDQQRQRANAIRGAAPEGGGLLDVSA